MIDRILRDVFGVLFCQFWSIVLQSGARLHILLKLLDRAVSGARFLTGGVIECDISHRRSVAVVCMLYKIRCNSVHPLNGALPRPHVPVRVTRSALVPHRYTYPPPRCRTLQFSRTFIHFSVFLWNDLANSVFDGVRLAGFKSRNPPIKTTCSKRFLLLVPRRLSGTVSLMNWTQRANFLRPMCLQTSWRKRNNF